MSQEELGRRVGVQRAAIQKYEKGVVENIPIKTIEKIASVFDVSPNYLVGWTEDNYGSLAMEVRILQGIKKIYGNDCVGVLETYVTLNSIGKRRLYQYLSDMERLYSENNI